MTFLIAPRATINEFGHSPLIADRVFAEHCAAIAERERIESARRKAERDETPPPAPKD